MFVSPFADPFDAFAALWSEVRHTAPAGFEPDTVTLATATADGRPSARVVLLRGAGRDGFRFYTNYGSRKGGEIEANPRAALCGFWYWMGRQVRIEGRVERTTAAESDAYFATRPRGSQLGAWASKQSAPLASREDLEAALEAAEGRFQGVEVPRPEGWGGYRLVPDRFEFWEEGASRLHDRLVFVRDGAGWSRTRLSP